MVKLTKIDPMSAAKINGVIGVIAGFIVGIIFAGMMYLMSLTESSMPPGSEATGVTAAGMPLLFAGMGFAIIIIAPIFYGILGFLGGLSGSALYNVIARKIGGLEIELEQGTKPK